MNAVGRSRAGYTAISGASGGVLLQQRAPSGEYGRRVAAFTIAVLVISELALHGANSSGYGAAAAMANLCFAFAMFAFGRINPLFWRRTALSFAFLVAAAGWAAFGITFTRAEATAPDLFDGAMLLLLSQIGLFFAAAALGYRRNAVRQTLTWLVVAGGAYVVLLLVLRETGMLTELGFLDTRGRARFAATIGNWNAAGAALGMIALLAAGNAGDRLETLWLRRGDARTGYAAAFYLMVLFCATVLCAQTQSRLSTGLTIVALLVLLFVALGRNASRWPRAARTLALVAIGTGFLAALAMLAGPAILGRTSLIADDLDGRMQVLAHYGTASMQAPLWGHGLGSFAEWNQQQLQPDDAAAYWMFGAAHNVALQLAIEAGWPCVALLSIGLALPAIRIVRAAWHAGIDLPGLSALLAVALVAGCSMLDIALNVPAIAALAALLFGLCWGRALRTDLSGRGEA